MSGWIEEFKRAVTVHVVFPALGMADRGHKRWTPCPACGIEKLGDGRAPVGVSARGGWQCHTCQAKGDALSALCWKVTGQESPSSEGWEQVRQAVVQHGWIRDGGPPTSGRVRPLAAAVGKRPAPSAPPTTPEETPQEAASTRGAFRWTDSLPDRCARVIADPESAGVGKGTHEEWVALKVVEYLTVYRGLSEAVILDAKLGVLVDEAGKPVIDGGRPWLTIPLADKAGRFVNVHFRRVPIPGTCEDCDALGRWRECELCRKGKRGFPRYKLCGGRPTPLYGADRLTPRKGAVARVTEGEFDVLALRTYGLGENAVSGTAGAGTFADDWLDSLEPFDSVFLCYDSDDSGQKGASELAEKLGRYKCGRVTFPHKDVGDCLIAKVQPDVIRRAFEVADSYVDVKLRKANEFRDALDALIETPNLLKGVSTTSEVLDTAFGGWSNGLIVVTGESGSGKAQPLDEPVLTPSGWCPIGSLKVGDEVISVHGTPTKVIGVYPQGMRPIRAVTFTDDVVVRCDADHLWAVASDLDVWREKPWRVMKTDDIAKDIKIRSRSWKWRVPLVAPVQFQARELPVDPYILGVLIGDGCLTNSGCRFSSPDQEIVDEVARRLPGDLIVKTSPSKSKAMDCRIVSSRRGDENSVVTGIASLGLRGKRSQERFIPSMYMLGSIDQRMDLLRGLLDTDGTISSIGALSYNTSSIQLAEDVRDLVRSLGGSSKRSEKIPSYIYKGEHLKGLLHFTLAITLPPDLHATSFLLPKKAERLTVRQVQAQRKIMQIEDAGHAECVCIAVADPSHLYVTRGYTVTHNTTLTTWQLWALAKAGHTVAITSFEQQPIMTVLQLLSMELGGDPTECTREARSEAMDRLTALPLYIVDHYGQMPYTKLEEALKYAVRRCGVRYILVDHLGFLVSPEADDERRAIEAVIRSLVLLRKDMDVTLFLIVHPRNDPDASKKWGRVTMQHLKGASAIRQDADMVLVVTRELPNQVKGRMCPKDKPRPWPQARIYIDKKRGRFGAVSGAGEVVLAFDPKSQVFADTWAQTPMGKTGALMDAVNTETPDEGDEPKTRGSRKAGTSGRGRGRKTRETTDF